MEIDYNLGFKLSKANFEKLYKASKLLYLADNFGVACSLNILACEELIKSFVLHLNMLYPNIQFQNSRKMFTDHKIKHNELRNFIQVTHIGSDAFEFNILDNKEEFLSILPEDKIEEYQKEYMILK